MQMKLLTISMLVLAMIAGAARANAGGKVDDCHNISDSVYGVWGCR
jgi:hypothetical protein